MFTTTRCALDIKNNINNKIKTKSTLLLPILIDHDPVEYNATVVYQTFCGAHRADA